MDKKTKKILDKKLKTLGLDFMATQIMDNKMNLIYNKIKQQPPTFLDKAEVNRYGDLLHKRHDKCVKKMEKYVQTDDGVYAMRKIIANYLPIFDVVEKLSTKIRLEQYEALQLGMLQLAHIICEILITTKDVAQTKEYILEFYQDIQKILEEKDMKMQIDSSTLPQLIDQLTKVFQLEGLEIKTYNEEEAN